MKKLLRSLAVLALAGGLMIAGEPGEPVKVELHDAPLADAIQRLSEATGRKIDASAVLLTGKTVNFVSRGTAEEVLAAFGATLEKSQSLTMIYDANGSIRVHGFRPAKLASQRPAPRGQRLSVDVAEGTVALIGDRGRVMVNAGERSSVEAGVVPAQPVSCDLAAVAPWRFLDAAPTGQDVRVSLPEIRLHLVGYTDDGKPIVEYEYAGERRATEFGTLESPDLGRHRLVVENGGLDLPINFHVTVDKGTNK